MYLKDLIPKPRMKSSLPPPVVFQRSIDNEYLTMFTPGHHAAGTARLEGDGGVEQERAAPRQPDIMKLICIVSPIKYPGVSTMRPTALILAEYTAEACQILLRSYDLALPPFSNVKHLEFDGGGVQELSMMHPMKLMQLCGTLPELETLGFKAVSTAAGPYVQLSLPASKRYLQSLWFALVEQGTIQRIVEGLAQYHPNLVINEFESLQPAKKTSSQGWEAIALSKSWAALGVSRVKLAAKNLCKLILSDLLQVHEGKLGRLDHLDLRLTLLTMDLSNRASIQNMNPKCPLWTAFLIQWSRETLIELNLRIQNDTVNINTTLDLRPLVERCEGVVNLKSLTMIYDRPELDQTHGIDHKDEKHKALYEAQAKNFRDLLRRLVDQSTQLEALVMPSNLAIELDLGSLSCLEYLEVYSSHYTEYHHDFGGEIENVTRVIRRTAYRPFTHLRSLRYLSPHNPSEYSFWNRKGEHSVNKESRGYGTLGERWKEFAERHPHVLFSQFEYDDDYFSAGGETSEVDREHFGSGKSTFEIDSTGARWVHYRL
ncbi:hypothetical protein T439DRAFT_327777 [Meredithblackwellia eburnea MCA 4105]